jgi:signal transduction histidine kinase
MDNKHSLLRINTAFQAFAVFCYLAQSLLNLVLWLRDGRSIIPIALSVAAMGISARFLFARKKREDSTPAIAYNWGFILIVVQTVAFQLTYQYSLQGLCVYFIVLCQLAIIYRTGASTFLMLLSSTAYSIVMLFDRDYRAVALILFSSTLGIGMNILISRLNREFLISDSFFSQARWAASELSDVLMHLDRRVEDIRTEERRAVSESLSREIHDSVGCMLTALIVQLQVLKETAIEGSHRSRIESLEEMSKSTLREVREEVANLRKHESGSSEIRTYDRLLQLHSIFSECTGVEIAFRIEEETVETLEPAVGDEIFRIIQESFTNAYCHGCASIIDLSMKRKDGSLLLRISDNGNGCKKVVPGNGLRGIAERVSLMGGTLAYETMPGKGFDIGIDIPIGPPEASAAAGGPRDE